MITSAKMNFRIPAALIALTLVPILGGLARLFSLASGAEITPENTRFFTAPFPVIIHIISSVSFCVLGAFQFASDFRRRRPDWHRNVGRFLIVCGLVSALSAVWMTLYYPIPLSLQGNLLYGVRILMGSAMFLFIMLALQSILRRHIPLHRAWMIRSYAIAQGAGTQALIMLPLIVVFGEVIGLTRDILMTVAWVINLAIAEIIIQRSNKISSVR